MKNPFEVLAKISSAEAVEDSELVKLCAGMMKAIETLENIIEGSPFHGRAALRKNINEAAGDALMLCQKPELICRSCVGVVYSNSAGKKIVSQIFGDKFIDGLPCLLVHADKVGYSMSNKFGQELNFSNDEYDALIELSKHGINLKDLVSSVSYLAPMKRRSAVVIIMPDEKLIRLCDVVIAVGGSKADAPGDIPVCEARSASELENFLDQYNGKSNNVTLTDRLKAEMFTYEAELDRLVANYRKTSEALGREARMQNIAGTSELIADKIREIDGLIRNLERWKNWQAEFQQAERKTLFEMSEALESAMLKTVPSEIASKDFSRIHAGLTSPKSMLLKIALKLIALGNVNAALSYQRKAESVYPDTAFLIGLYCRGSIGYSEVEKLRYMPDSDDILKTKIHFRRELNLSEKDCANIAGILRELESPDELYFYAMHVYNLYRDRRSVSFSDVTNAFRRAVLAGSNEAAYMFAQYCAGNGIFDGTKEIADMAFPIATWACFLLCMKDGKTALAGRYLNFSAALGNSDALKFLADSCWNDRRKSSSGVGFDPNYGKFTGIDTRANSRAISIYEHLDNYSNVSDFREKLAHFYFCAGNFTRARDLLPDTPRTADGAFDLAVMLKYAHGGGRDLNRANRLITRAEELGHPFAKALNERWFIEEAQKLRKSYGM